MSEVNTATTVSPSTATRLIKVALKSKRPVFLWGPPGIGKSDLIESIGKSYEQRDENGNIVKPARPVVDLRLLLMDPTDLKGMPFYNPDLKKMQWAPSSELPTQENGLENAILFLDEMNAAPPSVQAAAYQLILNRRIGEYVLPKGVDIVAAGNRESDRGVTYRMPSPLANRFVHFDMEPSFDDWKTWALNNNVHPDVVGFLSKHSQKLFTFDPKSPDKSFATPRSWAFVSQLLTDAEEGALSESDITTLVAGTVGSGIAIEFSQHRKFAAQLPDPMDVLNGKVKKLDTNEISAHYSLVVSLCYRLKNLVPVMETDAVNRPAGYEKFDSAAWHKCVDNYFSFMLNNLQPEMVILGSTTAIRKNMFGLPIKHREVPSFKKLYEQYGDMIMGN